MPRGFLHEDELLYTGKVGSDMATTFPFAITRADLDRGQERFNIYCAPCHGRTGEGNGMVVQRGFKAPPSYHIDRLRTAPVGYFFDVITNGFGAMPDYSAQVTPEDRWLIVAYIRALQLTETRDRRRTCPPTTEAAGERRAGRRGRRQGTWRPVMPECSVRNSANGGFRPKGLLTDGA